MTPVSNVTFHYWGPLCKLEMGEPFKSWQDGAGISHAS